MLDVHGIQSALLAQPLQALCEDAAPVWQLTYVMSASSEIDVCAPRGLLVGTVAHVMTPSCIEPSVGGVSVGCKVWHCLLVSLLGERGKYEVWCKCQGLLVLHAAVQYLWTATSCHIHTC